jgi:hypothetical protein
MYLCMYISVFLLPDANLNILHKYKYHLHTYRQSKVTKTLYELNAQEREWGGVKLGPVGLIWASPKYTPGYSLDYTPV